MGLSQALHRDLQHRLYKDLHRTAKALVGDSPAAIETGARLLSDAGTPSGAGPRIRQLVLLPGETVTHAFSTEKGLVPHPEEQGRMLVLTNRRVITFGQREGMRETVVMPLDEVKAVAVNAGRRGLGTMFQGGLMVVAGIFFYVMLAYWLTGRVGGPTIPIIRMDLVAFLVFLAVVSGLGMIAQFYFGRPDGEVTFQGDGVKFTFPFRGESSEDQIYTVVNAAFAARQVIVDDPQPSPN